MKSRTEGPIKTLMLHSDEHLPLSPVKFMLTPEILRMTFLSCVENLRACMQLSEDQAPMPTWFVELQSVQERRRVRRQI